MSYYGFINWIPFTFRPAIEKSRMSIQINQPKSELFLDQLPKSLILKEAKFDIKK